MRVVESLDELKSNIDVFEHYINGERAHKDFLLYLIRIGKCFIVVNINGKTKFYPSKFIGYNNITIDTYSSWNMDGRDTNKAINKILNCKCQKDIEMSERFIEYCKELGLKGSENKKFWLNEINL